MQEATVQFKSYAESVSEVLERIKAGAVLQKQNRIIIKPNLINASPPPITTPVACCEALVDYVRTKSGAEIIIAEGCGEPSLETAQIFENLGYKALARRKDILLMDLNTEPSRRLEGSGCPVFPKIYLPKIVFTGFLISVPVLKAHSLADITGSLKNMIGLAPPKHYAGRHGSWKKAVFHHRIHQAIRDLNHYRSPDLTLMDASVGLAEFHLGGPACDPPVGKLVAGYDALAVDRIAAGLLGLDWQKIPHLAAVRH